MVTALMLQSPLADNLGKTLAHLGVSGQVLGDVKLAIGLKQPGVLASGQVELQDASMSLQAPKMQLDKLQGQLRCGTNCGSCLPELKRMVRATGPLASKPMAQAAI